MIMYLTLMMENIRLFWSNTPLFPSLLLGKRRYMVSKRRCFFIIKVRYIIICNFLDNEPISIIFDDYESWVFPFRFSFVSSRKGQLLHCLRRGWKQKSGIETEPTRKMQIVFVFHRRGKSRNTENRDYHYLQSKDN